VVMERTSLDVSRDVNLGTIPYSGRPERLRFCQITLNLP
jgi:hypothetical protein